MTHATVLNRGMGLQSRIIEHKSAPQAEGTMMVVPKLTTLTFAADLKEHEYITSFGEQVK